MRLSKLPRASRTEGEFSLDGEDNWLPDTALFGAFASNEHWNHHLDRYIRSIVEAFDGELHRSAIGRAVQIQCRPDFRLKTVETVWEFLHPAPTELVAALAPLLFAYCGREAEIHHFPPMEGRTENALSVQISLRAGVKLRVYAKTNRRVRFEIIHDEINVRELLQEPASERSNAPPRQHRPWSQILNCLSSLRQRAAEELNTVLSYLRQRHQIAPSAFSPMRLIISIATALHDVDMTQTVLSLLTRNGMIATRRAGSELLAAVRLLVSAGVLERDEERRCYDVTLPYQQPLARLRQADLRRLGNGGIQRRRGN